VTYSRRAVPLVYRLSTLSVIWMVDAVVGLVQVHNMYTFKPTGAAGMLLNAVSFVVAMLVFFGTPRGRIVLRWLGRQIGSRRRSDSPDS
jgi:hypothetical protein